MSKAYEDLTDNERLTRSMHLERKIGPALTGLLKSMEHQLDQMVLSAIDIVRDSHAVELAVGPDLDNIGSIYGIHRRGSETDEDLSARIQSFPTTYETLTVDAIQDLFEGITGRRPYVYEGFSTRVYRSGDPTESGDAGRFTMLFEVPRNIVHENLKVQPSGTYVIISHSADQLVSATDTLVSATTTAYSTHTTIYAQSVAGFEDSGKIKIGTEWIRYGSLNTTAISFEDCDRGLWDTAPETHSTGAPVVEGVMFAWREGTNNMIYDYGNGRNIYLTGGPYDEWTRIDMEYKITDLDSDYDEISEIIEAIGEFRAVGLEYKAAGVRADFEVGLIFQEWWQGTEEALTMIEESFKTEIDANPDSEAFQEDLPMPDFTGVFTISYWDDATYGIWDKALWSIPGTEISGAYNLEIKGH